MRETAFGRRLLAPPTFRGGAGAVAAMAVAAALTVAACGGEPDTPGQGDVPEGTPPSAAPSGDTPPGQDAPDTRAEAPAQEPDPIDQVQAALAGPDPAQRLGAAWGLQARSDVPPEDGARLLLDALSREIDSPTPGPGHPGSYLNGSEWARYVYTRSLGALDPEGLEPIRQAAAGGGEAAARATLALGFAGDPEAVPGLLALLESSDVGDIRADAAFLLGELGAGEAIPALEQAALDDPYRVTVSGLAGREVEMYPVRSDARRALRALGAPVPGPGG